MSSIQLSYYKFDFNYLYSFFLQVLVNLVRIRRMNSYEFLLKDMSSHLVSTRDLCCYVVSCYVSTGNYDDLMPTFLSQILSRRKLHIVVWLTSYLPMRMTTEPRKARTMWVLHYCFYCILLVLQMLAGSFVTLIISHLWLVISNQLNQLLFLFYIYREFPSKDWIRLDDLQAECNFVVARLFLWRSFGRPILP